MKDQAGLPISFQRVNKIVLIDKSSSRAMCVRACRRKAAPLHAPELGSDLI
jgi:hypothetical protein